MALTITSLVNNADGMKAVATVLGTPSGTVKFYQSEAPEDLNGAGAYGTSASQVSVGNIESLGGGQYRLKLSTIVHPIPQLFYVKVADNNGEASEYSTWQDATTVRAHEAVWLSLESTPRSPMLQVARWLLDTINWNRKGIDAAVEAAGYVSAETKVIQLGLADSVQGSPSAMIAPAEWEIMEEPIGRIDIARIRWTIQGFIRVMDQRPETECIVSFADALYTILRRECYTSKVLPSSFTLAWCGPTGYTVQEAVDPLNQRVSLFRLNWEADFGGYSMY